MSRTKIDKDKIILTSLFFLMTFIIGVIVVSNINYSFAGGSSSKPRAVSSDRMDAYRVKEEVSSAIKSDESVSESEIVSESDIGIEIDEEKESVKENVKKEAVAEGSKTDEELQSAAKLAVTTLEDSFFPIVPRELRAYDDKKRLQFCHTDVPIVELTPEFNRQLASFHKGDHLEAVAFRKRDHLPMKPRGKDAGTIDERILVLSDMHLNAGKIPDLRTITPNEDFQSNEQRDQFVKFLSREWAAAACGDQSHLSDTKKTLDKCLDIACSEMRFTLDATKILSRDFGCQKKKYPLTLVFAGDTFDFIQTGIKDPYFPYPDGFRKDGDALKPTPQNLLTVLNIIHKGHPEFFKMLATHLMLGHKIEILPGNHDRQILHPLLQNGEVTLSNGTKVKGLKLLLADEIRKQGIEDENEINQMIDSLKIAPFAIHNDVWIEHGDATDTINKVRHPYADVLRPVKSDQETQSSMGDNFVRHGYNKFEEVDPESDNMLDTDPILYKRAILDHPIDFMRTLRQFMKSVSLEMCPGSKEEDCRMRQDDARELIRLMPELEKAVKTISKKTRNMSSLEIQEFFADLEREGTNPVYSIVKKGMFTLSKYFKIRKEYNREEEIFLRRMYALNNKLGINVVVNGHTHVAEDRLFVTDKEKEVHYLNTHTWMDFMGNYGDAKYTWAKTDRGVVAIELGTSTSGKKWENVQLHRVNGDGYLKDSDIFRLRKPKAKEYNVKLIKEKVIAKKGDQ